MGYMENKNAFSILFSSKGCPRQKDPAHRIFSKFSIIILIIIQAILSRKSMEKFAVTDEKIFLLCKVFDRKK